ncbi:GNAT family N-acetyltransferase [Onishia taeanensis]
MTTPSDTPRIAQAPCAAAHALTALAALAPRFHRRVPGLGDFRLRPLDPAADLPRVQAWVSEPRAHFWGMQEQSLQETETFYAEMQASTHAHAFIGLFEGEPAFLVEVYDPAQDPLGEQYPVVEGDVGMHFLVAPTDTPRAGFSTAVIETIMAFLFEAGATRRVVVEPDVENANIHPLNRRVGVEYQGEISLADKTARLGFCTRKSFAAALAATSPRQAPALSGHPERAADHLTPERWAIANRWLVRKAIAEFSHERLLAPVPQTAATDARGSAGYVLRSPEGDSVYRFTARRLALDHWAIDQDTLAREVHGRQAPLDAAQFILEFAPRLGLGEAMLPLYLEELASTLSAFAYKLDPARPDAKALAEADFQTLEAAMNEGHPVFIANSGRQGFDAIDHRAYAPEAAAPAHLIWLAVTRDRACFSSLPTLSYQALLEEELGAGQVADFHRRLSEQGLDPDAYLLMPAHPWQWCHKLATGFAADVATRRIVCLGYGADRYQAQQSIRTWFNQSRPERRYVKTALSIVNMGFMRGLSPHYMQSTPAINAWIKGLVDEDPYLTACGFDVLREEAAIGYRRDDLEAAFDKHSAHKKMLACLWRESPAPRLATGQRLTTMAALLHVDAKGQGLLPALIAGSGLSAEAWLDRYLDAYFKPLLHAFFAHDLVFMPHGENLILILEGQAPVGALMKDIAEEIAVMDPAAREWLPEDVRRIAVEVPEPLKVLSIFTDVFDCLLRFMAAILDEAGTLPEQRFWARVAAAVLDYQRQHPQFADKFARHDLFAPRFRRSCLNRLQLRNHQQMVDLTDPAGALQFSGELDNPIAAFAPDRRAQAQAQAPTEDQAKAQNAHDEVCT